MLRDPFPAPHFHHWRRAVDLKLECYTGITLRDLPFHARVWFGLWRKGYPAQTVAELLTDQVIGRYVAVV